MTKVEELLASDHFGERWKLSIGSMLFVGLKQVVLKVILSKTLLEVPRLCH